MKITSRSYVFPICTLSNVCTVRTEERASPYSPGLTSLGVVRRHANNFSSGRMDRLHGPCGTSRRPIDRTSTIPLLQYLAQVRKPLQEHLVAHVVVVVVEVDLVRLLLLNSVAPGNRARFSPVFGGLRRKSQHLKLRSTRCPERTVLPEASIPGTYRTPFCRTYERARCTQCRRAMCTWCGLL